MPTPNYVKSLSLINSLGLPINLRAKFRNGEQHEYTCRQRGCKILNDIDNGSFTTVNPIVEMTFAVPRLDFAQIVSMSGVKGVRKEFFQLTKKENVDDATIERVFNATSADEGSFDQNLAKVQDVPLIYLNDMNSFENDNQFLILKRIELKK